MIIKTWLQRVWLDDFEVDIVSIEKDDSGRGSPATWIDDGEKYALVGLRVKVEEYIPSQKFTSCLWVLTDGRFTGEAVAERQAARGLLHSTRDTLAALARPDMNDPMLP